LEKVLALAVFGSNLGKTGRERMNRIVWLTGQSGSGKSTLARRLQEDWPCIILCGNEMRNSISLGAGFSRKERAEHNYKVARLAKELSKQTNVVVSVIAPIKKVREEIDEICSPTWVYIKRNLPEREGHFYEESLYDTIDIDVRDKVNAYKRLKKILKREKKVYSLFIGRWQPLHDGHLALIDRVRQEGRNIAIGVRDTQTDHNNPLTAHERLRTIQELVPDAKVFIMPDIDEVVYGRQVGWDVREICLSEEVEAISSTKIREGTPNDKKSNDRH
jgi:cytidyltransferase-like protein